MEILVEVFLPSGVCSCSSKLFREQMNQAKIDIEDEYKDVSVDIDYYPVHAKRAWDLGVTKADSIVINGKIVLEGYYTASNVKKEMEKAIREMK